MPGIDDLELVRDLLRVEPPHAATTARGQQRLAELFGADEEQVAAGPDRAVRTHWLRLPGRRWRPVLAAGLAAAIAAGFVAVQAVAPGGALPADALTVGRLVKLAAAEAELQAVVRPGQWVFWEKKLRSPTYFGLPNGITDVWSTADARKVAYRRNGILRVVRCTVDPCPHLGGGDAFATHVTIHRSQKGTSETFGASLGKAHPVRYGQLGSLPRSPQALERYLARLGYGPGGPATRAFSLIDFLLTSYVMPPKLTAELYRALGDIPGVTVDEHAVDVAGRPGVGFKISAGAARYEIILARRDYRLMGDENRVAGYGFSVSGEAILRQAPVSGPGVLP